jgi:hypothetical protein
LTLNFLATPDVSVITSWRIVVLTDQPDPRYAEAFARQTAAGGLPGFLEIYLARDLGVTLRRR